METPLKNPWEGLSAKYNTHEDDLSKISPDAADNILLAWPALLRAIKQTQPNPKGLCALEFGCGTGGFCLKLNSLGYSVVGSDSAENMISRARASVGNSVRFYVADQHNLSSIQEKPFDLVTAIMVFQFIEDIDRALKSIAAVTKPNGVLAFAVFNPDYIKPNHGDLKPFRGFNEPVGVGAGYYCPTTDFKIPVFIRDEIDYDKALGRFGYRRLAADRPPFTKEFLEQYPTYGEDTTYAQYIVMAYQKTP